MTPQKAGLTLAKKAYNQTKLSLKTHPVIFVPFLIFAGIEFIALIILYLAPRMPFKLLLGPPIKTFWGEAFLHYPTNFLLLPQLTSLSRIGLSVLFGSLLTGMAVAMVFDAFNHKAIKWSLSLKSALKKYFSLFTLVLILTLSLYILIKIITIGLRLYFIAGHTRLLFLKAGLWLGPILFCINFAIAVLIQSALIYAIPVLMIEKERFIKSIIKSFRLFKNLFVPTIILVGLPMLLYIPVMVLNSNTSLLIQRLFPEFILLVAVFNIIVLSLVIDPIVTVSTTFLYLQHKE